MATRDVEPRRPALGAEAAPEFDTPNSSLVEATGSAGVRPPSGISKGHSTPDKRVPIAAPHTGKRNGTASQRGFGPDPGNDLTERALFRAYMEAAGWELDVSNETLAKHFVSREDVKHLRHGSSDMVPGANGKIYRKHPDHPGKIIGYDPARLPASEVWSAARMTPMDYFALHYQLAKTEPMTVFQDLMTVPTNQVGYAEANLHRTEWQLATQLDHPPQNEALIAAQLQLAIAKRAQFGLAKQFYMMRNDVFHTDVEERKAAARLRSEGFDTTQFHADAQFKCTPDQIRELEARYRERVPAKVAGLPVPAADALNSRS